MIVSLPFHVETIDDSEHRRLMAGLDAVLSRAGLGLKKHGKTPPLGRANVTYDPLTCQKGSKPGVLEKLHTDDHEQKCGFSTGEIPTFLLSDTQEAW